MRPRHLAALTAVAIAFAPAAPGYSSGTAEVAARTLPPVPGATAGRYNAADQVTPAAAPPWLKLMNRYRSLAGLPGVTENSTWSSGDRLHSRYTVKNNVIDHDENPNKPYYTAAGRSAAQNGNVMASSSVSTTDVSAINGWMQGPFHAVGMIDPRLTRTGFGSFRANDGGWRMAATLDVIRGLDSLPAGVTYPIEFPSGTAGLPIRSYFGNEYPDPLSSCAHYSAPSGPPIILQVGDGSLTPNVTAHSLKLNGVALAHCEFDETNYRSPDPYAEYLGRAVLDGRDAIVLLPKKPLKAGKTYHVSIRANGTTYEWSFKVA